MQNDRIAAMGATRVNVGLSAIIKITPYAFQGAAMMKIISGGGTLEIAPIPIALTGTSAIGWGLGYPVGSNEILSVMGPTQFYLAATGATMTVALIPAHSSGVTLTV